MDVSKLRSLPAGLVDLFTDVRAVGLTSRHVIVLLELYEQQFMNASVNVWLALFNHIRISMKEFNNELRS